MPQMLGSTDGNFLAATLCIAELLHHFGDVLGVATKPTFLQLHVRDPVFPPFYFVCSFLACSLASKVSGLQILPGIWVAQMKTASVRSDARGHSAAKLAAGAAAAMSVQHVQLVRRAQPVTACMVRMKPCL